MARNTTDEGRRKGAETARRNLGMIPTGGIRDPEKANAAFERALDGRCFCPRGKHNPNCTRSPSTGAMSYGARARQFSSWSNQIDSSD